MSMASSPFPRRRDRQSPSAGRPPEPREANAPSPAMPQRRRSQGYGQPSWPGISKDRPMTADTPTSVATINHLLLGAPYTSPLVIPGDWLVDELEGAVEVGGFTDGLFRWPTRKRSGRPSPILCGDLLRAVRTECAESVQFWWGFSPSLVGRWRRALGVTRRNNPGDQAVAPARAALARSLVPKATRVSPARPRSFPRTAGATATMRSGASPRKICCASTTSSAARYGARSRPARPAQRYSTGPRSWACNGSGRNTREAGRRPLPPRRERASAQPR